MYFGQFTNRLEHPVWTPPTMAYLTARVNKPTYWNNFEE